MSPSFFLSESVKNLGIFSEFIPFENLVNRKSNPDLDSIKQQLFKQCLIEYIELSFDADPVLQGYRDAREKLETSGYKHSPSPEKLINLLLKRKELPAINLLVDICNCVSLESRLSIGIHQLDKIGDQVNLELTKGDELFIPLGSKKATKIAAGEFAYTNGENKVLCRFDSAQCDHTKVTEETVGCLIIVQGNANTPSEYVQQAVGKITGLIEQFCGEN
jgi:DNA/RNA-binding domain of Phe-tRNA-synthetase-like protein